MRLPFGEVVVVPKTPTKHFLGSLLFIAMIAGFIIAGNIAHKKNPNEKIIPTIGQMVDGVKRSALPLDPPEGREELTLKQKKDQFRLWKDTWATGQRFVISVVILFLAAWFGVMMGVYPYMDAFTFKYMTFLNSLVAMSLMAIIMVVFGTGNLAKIMLVQFGVFPFIALDARQRAMTIPVEQLITAKTLAASNAEIAYRIIMPQVLPQILDSIRLSLKSVMVYLIAAEAIAANAGLGYRTFVMQRYIAMDVIIPYVIGIALFMFCFDVLFRIWIRWQYPWYKSN